MIIDIWIYNIWKEFSFSKGFKSDLVINYTVIINMAKINSSWLINHLN